MANETKGKTWLLDSAGQITTRKLKLERIDWTANTADADDLSLREIGASGDDIVLAKANHTNEQMTWYFDEDQVWNGMTLAVIDSGNVLVTIREIL